MPAMMTCPICGYDGPHGFNEPYVGGIVHFYHLAGDCQGAWTVDNKWFSSLQEAWQYIRPKLAAEPKTDSSWLAAWDARIMEKNETKAMKLFRQWEKLSA